MKRLHIIVVFITGCLILGIFSANVRAYESTVTNCPSSYAPVTGYGWITNSWKVAVRDHNYAWIALSYDAPMFIATASFTNPDPGDIGTQPLPPDNAYIVWVEMVLIVYAETAQITPFTLQYCTGESQSNVTDETAIWHSGSNGTQTILGPNQIFGWHEHYKTYFSNITSMEDWTVPMLKDTTPDGYTTWVRVLLDISWPHDSPYVYVDYVGFEYVWTMDPAWSSGPPGSSVWSGWGSIGVVGIMGIVGFVGMIGVPAAMIWFYKRDGGSKITAGIMGLVSFLLCFGFFIGSINGG